MTLIEMRKDSMMTREQIEEEIDRLLDQPLTLSTERRVMRLTKELEGK